MKARTINKIFPTIIAAILAASLSIANKQAAAEANIAVASNFARTAKQIAKEFETKTGDKITLAFGSTGKHYAQIINGAPFDAFFAADEKRPLLLEKQNLIIPSSRFTYAVGKLILWSSDETLISDGPLVLNTRRFSHLAIANPRLAPYGLAAKQVLTSLKLWPRLETRIVRGENASQTFQFIKSGNAQLGFIPVSFVQDPKGNISGSFWVPDQRTYQLINQQAILLTTNKVAKKFIDFVRSARAKRIIAANGFANALDGNANVK